MCADSLLSSYRWDGSYDDSMEEDAGILDLFPTMDTKVEPDTSAMVAACEGGDGHDQGRLPEEAIEAVSDDIREKAHVNGNILGEGDGDDVADEMDGGDEKEEQGILEEGPPHENERHQTHQGEDEADEEPPALQLEDGDDILDASSGQAPTTSAHSLTKEDEEPEG